MNIKYNDKEYELKPLNLPQQLEHLAYLKMQVINEVKKHMVGLPLELCKHIWDEARKEVKAIEFGTPEYRIACTKFEALAQALVLSVNDKVFTLKSGIEVLEKDLDNLGLTILYGVLGFPKAN